MNLYSICIYSILCLYSMYSILCLILSLIYLCYKCFQNNEIQIIRKLFASIRNLISSNFNYKLRYLITAFTRVSLVVSISKVYLKHRMLMIHEEFKIKWWVWDPCLHKASIHYLKFYNYAASSIRSLQCVNYKVSRCKKISYFTADEKLKLIKIRKRWESWSRTTMQCIRTIYIRDWSKINRF